MKQMNSKALPRWRGVVLELVYGAFQKREPRYDYIMLWGMMRELGHDLGLNDVIFVLRQLRDRGYLRMKENRNKWTNDTEITEIEIVPQGCDVVEKLKSDDAVTIL
jgi:hypothetical protein